MPSTDNEIFRDSQAFCITWYPLQIPGTAATISFPYLTNSADILQLTLIFITVLRTSTLKSDNTEFKTRESPSDYKPEFNLKL